MSYNEVVSGQRRPGRMGATAKKAIGIMATAAAATIVTPLINKAKVASVNRNDTANDPARSRSPIAEASAMMNPTTLLRWRCNIGDRLSVSGYSLLVARLSPVIGMKSSRDVRVDESPSVDIRWLYSGRGSEPPKERSPARGRVRVSEVKCAVLR